MKNKPSKKHHYLPRHYLKGFTNNENTFFVYDKTTTKIFKSSPDAAFFQNNLNTIKFSKEKSSDFLEDLYTRVECQSWSAFDRIRNSTKTTSIDALDKANLFFFLLCLHWRLPSNLDFVNEMSKKAFANNEDLDFFKFEYKNGEKVSKPILDMIRNSSAFKKTMRLLVPFAPFHKNKNWMNNLVNWRFLYTRDNNNWFIVGDNPIVTKSINDNDPSNCLNEFLFPVSGKILLVNTCKPINKDFPPNFILLYSVAIIERSKRFVACQNKDFLESLIDHYNIYVKFNKTDTIIPEIFDRLII